MKLGVTGRSTVAPPRHAKLEQGLNSQRRLGRHCKAHLRLKHGLGGLRELHSRYGARGNLLHNQ